MAELSGSKNFNVKERSEPELWLVLYKDEYYKRYLVPLLKALYQGS